MFKLTIEGTTMAELAAAIAAVAAQFATTASDTKPATTRSRKPKDENTDKAEAEAPNGTTLDASSGTNAADVGSLDKDGAAADQAGSSTSTTATTDASPSDGPSKDDALKAAMLYGQSQGDDALKAKITAMGATKFSEIPPEKYGEFLKSLEAPAASILD